jgi:hypothetical protein
MGTSLVKNPKSAQAEPVPSPIAVKLTGRLAGGARLLLGLWKRRCLERAVLVSPEAVVPREHCSRHPDAGLDLSCVRDPVRGTDAPHGRPSIDPIVCFKLRPVLVFEGPAPGARAGAGGADRLSVRW